MKKRRIKNTHEAKYSNHFICDLCRIEFHRKRPIKEALKEHEIRLKQNIRNYEDDEKLVEICDDCFRKVMHLMGN